MPAGADEDVPTGEQCSAILEWVTTMSEEKGTALEDWGVGKTKVFLRYTVFNLFALNCLPSATVCPQLFALLN